MERKLLERNRPKSITNREEHHMTRNGITFLATAALIGLMTLPASAALSISITENGGPAFTCGPAAGSVVCISPMSADFLFDIQVAISNSPGGPAEITIIGSVNPLHAGDTLTVETSDTSFLLPVGPATLIQTLNTNTPVDVAAAPGSITGTGYASNLIRYSAKHQLRVPPQPQRSPSAISLSETSGSSAAGNIVTAPFSLDEVTNYTFTGAGTALVSATLSEVSVPEPASALLFGAILGAGLLFHRKQRSTRA